MSDEPNPTTERTETKQPTRIDAREYELFKKYVKSVHGGIQGHLREELENALREYRTSERDGQLTRVENDVATIKAMLADGQSDGGTTPHPSDGATHARTRNTHAADTDADPSAQSETLSKPPANAPRSRKEAYLRQTFFAESVDGLNEVAIETKLRELIEREFGFGDRTTDDYVDELYRLIRKELEDERGWKLHPQHRRTWVSPQYHEELTE